MPAPIAPNFRLARIDSRSRTVSTLECIHEGIEASYTAVGCIGSGIRYPGTNAAVRCLGGHSPASAVAEAHRAVLPNLPNLAVPRADTAAIMRSAPSASRLRQCGRPTSGRLGSGPIMRGHREGQLRLPGPLMVTAPISHTHPPWSAGGFDAPATDPLWRLWRQFPFQFLYGCSLCVLNR